MTRHILFILARYEGLPLDQSFAPEPWMAAIFILAAVVFAWIRNNYPNRFDRLFKSAMNVRMMRQNMREESAFSHRASLLLSVLFVLVAALIFCRAHVYFHWSAFHFSGVGLYATYCAIILSVYGFKTAIAEWVSAWSEGDFSMTEYLYSMYTYLKLGGILLLFPALLLTYGGAVAVMPALILSVLIFAVLLVLRTFRGVQGALQARVNGVYIILYLCGLEIMPFAVFLVLLLR